eukprot:TRINITY_DN7629_c0_g1_i2.p1 TRINITY_DN7629_c0_g1~~TRINITY_DN7629_c0_g1_i2.p1  ORF type:complete len:296 (+),score=40.10 TRINITY_DN7629_c0_g1_i2:453-1340(+)
MKFLKKFAFRDAKNPTFYLPDPTWPLHPGILEELDISKVDKYPYYDYKKVALDFDGLMGKLSKAPQNSVIVLQVCGHNPTGFDPSTTQWKQIAAICKMRQLFPFLDMAYQGFATGDMDRDAFPVRLFVKEGLEFFLAQSFSKNAGLYAERVGALHFTGKVPVVADIVKSQLMKIVRMTHSTCPVHGARVMARIVGSPEIYKMWVDELKDVSERIGTIRKLLYDKLVELKTAGNWEHIVRQIGMFSYSGLTKAQCRQMVDKHHIYMLDNGRMSMSGINTKNVAYVAKAIHDVVIKY